jgi:transposase
VNAITIGFDIAKSIFQVHGIDAHGKAVLQRKLRRAEVLRACFRKLNRAWSGSRHAIVLATGGRELTRLGHQVRLIPTQYVKPFVIGGKNDANDAAAICAAVRRADMHWVGIKSAEQQSVQSLHRMRARLIQERTAKSNQIRSMFAEEGFVFPTSIGHLRRSVVNLISQGSADLTPILRQLAAMYLEQLDALERWLAELHAQLQELFAQREDCRLLASVPGIGPVVATALVGTVGDPRQRTADNSPHGSD